MVEQTRKSRTFQEVREARKQALGAFHAAHDEGNREVREETRADGTRDGYGSEVTWQVERANPDLFAEATDRTESLKPFRNAHDGGSSKNRGLRW